MQCKLLLLVSRWGNAAYPCLQQLYWISENKINETTERPSQMNKQFLRFCSKSEKKHTHTQKEKRKHGQKKIIIRNVERIRIRKRFKGKIYAFFWFSLSWQIGRSFFFIYFSLFFLPSRLCFFSYPLWVANCEGCLRIFVNIYAGSLRKRLIM